MKCLRNDANTIKLAQARIHLCSAVDSIVDAVVLVGERLQPDTEKAVRLVKESNVAKGEFTVQQTSLTVYHPKKNAGTDHHRRMEALSVSRAGAPIAVEFSYVDPAATTSQSGTRI